MGLAWSPAPQMSVSASSTLPDLSLTRVGSTDSTISPSAASTPRFSSALLCVVPELLVKHPEELRSRLHERDLRVLRVEIGIVLGEVASVELRQRTRALDACRSSADHDDMERTVLSQLRVLVRCFPLAEDVLLEADRIGQRVHRKRVLWRAFGSEEIHLGAGASTR